MGPLGSKMVWPRPSILGDTEYALIMFSWSMVIALPEYGEKHIVVTTSGVAYACSESYAENGGENDCQGSQRSV